MTKIVGIRFRTAGKIYYFDPLDFELETARHVIVETARGIEMGTVLIPPKEVEDDKVVQPLKPVIRIATDEDEKIDGQLHELAEGILLVVYEMLRENSSLQREVSGICYQLAARGVMQAQEMLGSIAGDVLGTMTDEQINRLVYDKAEPDLLWIRMNGSIVGAAIGLVLFAVMQFI